MDEKKVYEFAAKYLNTEVDKCAKRVMKARQSGINLDMQEGLLELRQGQLNHVMEALTTKFN